jgi:hypothetical protein
MATVWTFGDSMTEKFNDRDIWSKQYIEWKGYVPRVYGEFLSETIGYDLQNLGKSGCDNYTIFETFCKTYSLIENTDIVIIGWTSPNRFRIVNSKNKWQSIVPNFKNYTDDFELVSQNTIDEILINRNSSNYIDEINNWIHFINLACSNKKIIHWSTIRGEGELDTHHFFEMERIKDETKGLINDLHFSERGHKDLTLELTDIIFNKNKFIKSNKLL